MNRAGNRERVKRLNKPKKVKIRKKWNRPTMKMLQRELTSTKDPLQRKNIQKKIDAVRAWSKMNGGTITYYPNRKRNENNF